MSLFTLLKAGGGAGGRGFMIIFKCYQSHYLAGASPQILAEAEVAIYLALFYCLVLACIKAIIHIRFLAFAKIDPTMQVFRLFTVMIF